MLDDVTNMLLVNVIFTENFLLVNKQVSPV